MVAWGRHLRPHCCKLRCWAASMSAAQGQRDSSALPQRHGRLFSNMLSVLCSAYAQPPALPGGSLEQLTYKRQCSNMKMFPMAPNTLSRYKPLACQQWPIRAGGRISVVCSLRQPAANGYRTISGAVCCHMRTRKFRRLCRHASRQQRLQHENARSYKHAATHGRDLPLHRALPDSAKWVAHEMPWQGVPAAQQIIPSC
jgi:hypothetical protein